MCAIIYHWHIIFIILTVLHRNKNGAAMANESEMIKSASPAHFVLIHGACHGGWSWYKVRTLLESAGHKVSCPDLKSAGIDPSDANTIFTFQELNQPLHDILTSLPLGEKIVLAGHSSGGASVSEAVQNFPEKIQVAIYVVGEMIRNTSQTEQETEIDELYMSKFTGLDDYDYIYGQGRDNPPTSVIFKREAQRTKLYNRSPLEDSTLAAMLLKPFPIRAQFLADGSDKVPRVFIRTLHDNLFPIEKQDVLIKRWPPTEVYTVEGDHCPMLSNPSQLSDVLVKVATKFSPHFLDNL